MIESNSFCPSKNYAFMQKYVLLNPCGRILKIHSIEEFKKVFFTEI